MEVVKGKVEIMYGRANTKADANGANETARWEGKGLREELEQERKAEGVSGEERA